MVSWVWGSLNEAVVYGAGLLGESVFGASFIWGSRAWGRFLWGSCVWSRYAWARCVWGRQSGEQSAFWPITERVDGSLDVWSVSQFVNNQLLVEARQRYAVGGEVVALRDNIAPWSFIFPSVDTELVTYKQTQREMRFSNEAADVQARLIRSRITEKEVKEVWRFGLMVKLQTKAFPRRRETGFYSGSERKRRVNEIFIWSIVMLMMRSGVDCVDRQSSWWCETMLLLEFFFPLSLLRRWRRKSNVSRCPGSPAADILSHNHHSWSFGSRPRWLAGPWRVVCCLSNFTVRGIHSQRYSRNKTTHRSQTQTRPPLESYTETRHPEHELSKELTG